MRVINFGTSATVRLIRCPLNTGFTVLSVQRQTLQTVTRYSYGLSSFCCCSRNCFAKHRGKTIYRKPTRTDRLLDQSSYDAPINADSKNYRPVSLTSQVTSKVMEHVVSCHISRHLSTNRILSQHQHCFRHSL